MAAVDKEHTDSKSGLTAKEQLHLIYKAVEPLYARRDAAFYDVDSKLSAIGLRRLTMDSLAPDEQKYIKRYFKDIIAPVLSPQIVDSHHPFPHLEARCCILPRCSATKRPNGSVFCRARIAAAGCVPAGDTVALYSHRGYSARLR